MTTIRILGTGCAKCEKLRRNTQQAIDRSDTDAEIEKVSDIMKITEFGVLTTPALAINGDVELVGTVPSPDEIAKLFV